MSDPTQDPTNDDLVLDGDAVAVDVAEPEVVDVVDVEEDAAEASQSDADDAADDADVDIIDAEDLVEEEALVRKRESPYDRPGRWYVVHTYAGYEKKVKANVEQRVASMNMEDRIFEVVIPTEVIAEFKNNKRVMVEKNLFPGYLLVRCQLDDDSWYAIRNTPNVTGFIGGGGKPTSLSRKEVENFLGKPEEEGIANAKKARPRLEYEIGQNVRVKEGPFADFNGMVAEINEDQLRLKVLVNIFGRETPVELEFAQVQKL
jgi:transcriptional antiterminator NusG